MKSAIVFPLLIGCFTIVGLARGEDAPWPQANGPFGSFNPHSNTTAYELFIELPYVDGRFLMRTWQGQVVCYDLRADK